MYRNIYNNSVPGRKSYWLITNKIYWLLYKYLLEKNVNKLRCVVILKYLTDFNLN